MLNYTDKNITLDEVVFEGRNQAYGGYVLRKLYDDTVIRGFIIAATVFTLAVAGPMLWEKFKPEETVEEAPEIKIDLAKLPPPPPPVKELPPPPPLPAAPPPPQVSTIKFPPPEIVKEEVIEEPPKVEDVKKAAISTETVKGDESAPQMENIEVQGDPGGTGSAVVEADPNQEFLVVEQSAEPTFDLAKYLQKNLRYPPQAQNAEVQGVVVVNFRVNRDGNVEDVKITKGIGYGCDEEALRIVSKMPSWTPPKQGGRAVNQRVQLPIRFRLN